MYRLNIFISFFLISTFAFAQNKADFVRIDAGINRNYLAARWDSVIYYGTLGLENKYDYFYLRKHLGEAYYYTQNYVKAIDEFEKACTFNSDDAQTLEYLYYSYVFSGKEGDARVFGAGLPEVIKEKVSFKKDFSINHVYLESGPVLSNNLSRNHDILNRMNTDSSKGIDLTGNSYYSHAGMNFNIGKRISVYAGMSYVNNQRQQMFKLTEHSNGGRTLTEIDTVIFHPMPMPGYTTYDTIYENRQVINASDSTYRFAHSVAQAEYYLKCSFHVAKGFDIIPFFHLLSSRATLFSVSNHPTIFFARDTIIRHTQYYFPFPPGSYVDTVFYTYLSSVAPLDHFEFAERDTSAINYAFGVSLQRDWGKCTGNFFGSASNLNGKRQRELGASLTWYPKGNLNLYFSTTLTSFGEQNRRNMILNQMAGIKIQDHIWLEGYATLGSMNNFTENNGFMVDNNPGVTRLRFGLTPIFVFKRFDFSIHYQYKWKESVLNPEESPKGNHNNAQFYNYQNHLIIGSIKWKLLKQKPLRPASFL